MAQQLGWAAAAGSIAAIMVLWFIGVRTVLEGRKSMVDSAAEQVILYRHNAALATEDTDLAAVLARSESIYRQAAENYNTLLACPWVCLPAWLMDFRPAVPAF